MQESGAVAIGIFDDRSHAQRAIAELKQAGFTEKQIGVTARGRKGDVGATQDESSGTHAKQGAVTGLAAGAGVGALWGFGVLAGVVPGIGTAIAGGTLAALLSSAAAGAATAGIAGTLIGLGIPEEDAKYYDEEFRAGRVVVTVQADSRGTDAASIIRRNSGYDASSRADMAARTSAASRATSEAPSAQATTGRAAGETRGQPGLRTKRRH
jgi:hypothetical protein